MAGIIAAGVGRLKQEVERFLSPEFLSQVAGELGLCWRETPLAVPHLVAWFARQILQGNCSMPELARLAGSRFTPEAYCLARQRLPVELLEALLKRVCDMGDRQASGRLWKGHRLWHLDGSSLSMPDTPELQAHFGQPGAQRKGCGFPVAHLLCLFDAASGLIQECLVAPLRTHDLTHASTLHQRLAPGDVVIGDRAFESFAHLALLQSQGLHALLPVHQKRQVDFVRKQRRTGKKLPRIERERIRRCGRRDQIVRWTKPKERPRYLSPEQYAALPETILVREIKREVRLPTGQRQTLVLITTLLDEKQYPADQLMALLKDRWQVEVNLRHLKTTMRMEILRSQSVAGIEKELRMFLIVYNLVRLILLEASQRQEVPVGRISFADALYWVRHGDLALPLPHFSLVPPRPGRFEPRAVKRRPKPYHRLTRPRAIMRQALRRQKP